MSKFTSVIDYQRVFFAGFWGEEHNLGEVCTFQDKQKSVTGMR